MTKLQKGCDGQQVAALQYILRDTYNISVDPDGRFGTKTETALKKFPKIVGLADDGIAGPKTWAKLLDV
jgi:peptidoglycan hydrolase-like protein with peptidoglycan-binding domain